MLNNLKYNTIIFFLKLLLIALANKSYSQNIEQDSTKIIWTEIADGVLFSEFLAPEKSFINDSKLTIVKIDPKKCEFGLYTASEYNDSLRTAEQWADQFNLNLVFNAGMFNLRNFRTANGYMQNYEHLNNKKFKSTYKSVIAFNPTDSNSKNPFLLADLTCNSWDSLKTQYNSIIQSIRMVDCNSQPLDWNKNLYQKCSMITLATDIENNLLVIFNRSPYTQNQIIEFMLTLPLNIKTATYLEGGPQTSLYISTNKFCSEKIGCYVSFTYERDDNLTFAPIPNVIGIKFKNKAN